MAAATIVAASGCGRFGYEPNPNLGADAGGGGAVDSAPVAHDAPTPDAPPKLPDANLDPNAWWDLAWPHRVKLILEPGDVGVQLTDVAVPVFLNNDRVDFSLIAEDGADLRFIGSDGRTELDYEIEQFVAGVEALVWVRLPSVALTAEGDHFWMYFGASNAEPGQRPSAVWSKRYAAVWHLGADLADGTRSDSSGSGNHLTSFGAVTTDSGILADATEFLPEPQPALLKIEDAAQTGLDTGAELSVEFWINAAAGGVEMVPLAKMDSAGVGTFEITRFADETFGFGLAPSCNSSSSLTGGRRLDAGRWHHVALSYNGARLQMILDGVLEADVTVADGAETICDSAAAFVMGAHADGVTPYQGMLDEVRISRFAVSPARMSFEVAAMQDRLLVYSLFETAPDPGQ
ncbi:MAG: hypothetical protein Tsb0020_45140 [Haliangiales bacterium]